jgi:[acyl-carrier-protein] S-malonyltransferase
MKVFLFPGQGTQKAGMHRLLLATFPDLSYVYDIAEQILGYDLRELTDEDLAHTKYAQPAIMACSLVSFFSKRNMGSISFKDFCVAGHSLGEFPAMVAAEILTLEDGFRVIKARAEAMEKCAAAVKGSMAAILKLTPDVIENVCEKFQKQGHFVAVANYNSPLQTVISGEEESVKLACEEFKTMGGRAMPLKTAGAFHTKLMQPAAEEFAKAIEKIEFSEPICAFYSNVTGSEVTHFSDFKPLSVKHIVSPVRFTNEIYAMEKIGADNFIELDPGRVLTGLIEKTINIAKTDK